MNRKVFTLIMFAVLVFLLGARAATAQWISLTKASELGNSITSFFPVIFKNYPTTSVIPSGVLYIFSSTATTTGNAGGRSAIQQICPSEDTSAHFCSIYEIESAWTTSGVLFNHPFPKAWIDFPNRLGTLAYTTAGYPFNSEWSGAGTCDTWTSSLNIKNGRTIYESAFDIAGETCDASLPIACCKRIP